MGRKKKIQERPAHYLVFEAETDNPGLISLLDVFCGSSKEKYDEYIDSDAFQMEYDIYLATTIKPTFRGIVCAEKGDLLKEDVVLEKLGKKVGDIIETFDPASESSFCKIERTVESKEMQDSAHYFIALSGEANDPQMQSILDYFCGLKENPEGYASSDKFREEYAKYCNTKIDSPSFYCFVTGVKAGGPLDRFALSRLQAKLLRLALEYRDFRMRQNC